jgi:hypothetical protein
MLKEHTINNLDNFICGWYLNDNYLFEDIIRFHNQSPNKQDGIAGGVVNFSVKKSKDLILPRESDLYCRYINHLQLCLDLYVEKYKSAADTAEWADLENINIQHYNAGDAYFGWHCERSGVNSQLNNRHLVFLTYLNDVDDAGETEFLYQKIKVKPQKGLTLIWPADWTFTHRGIPSNNDKYIVTGWLSFI